MVCLSLLAFSESFIRQGLDIRYIKAESNFECSKDEILEIIRRPGNLEQFHPYCHSNIALKWPGDGSVDEITYLNGLKYTREFFNWNDDGYDLKIGARKRDTIVNWRVYEVDKRTVLSIQVNPKLPYKNAVISWFAWNLFIRKQLQKYLDNVMRGFEYYYQQRTQVKPNQFGKHSWYS